MPRSPDSRSFHQPAGVHRPSRPRLRAIPPVAGKELFGPQHDAISALIRSATRITPEQDIAIEREWYRHRGNARFASRGSASQVASTAGRLEAQICARQQAWGAADLLCRDAIGDAAHALAVRDLIGDVFSQEQYDDLVAPWVAVMGPAHSDDDAPQ